MIKKILKFILPNKILAFSKKLHINRIMKESYYYDFKRYKQYSRSYGSNTSVKLAAEITALYHVIEKGLTMPEPRLGFGQEKIILLCESCFNFIEKYGIEEDQVHHAIQVILEYKNFHNNLKYQLNSSIENAINQLGNKISGFSPCAQKTMTKKEYFQNKMLDFSNFANSRASVRNFSTEIIPINKVIQALDLARNTPSACNRQTWRTYLLSDKKLIDKILEIQGGNRGFGHLTDKLIIIAGELGVFGSIAERNQVFIDGGMYAMNLLYSLHYNEIAACILNCSHTPEKDLKQRTICGIKKSEVFIAMVACGIPPNNFMITASKRYDLDKTNTIMN